MTASLSDYGSARRAMVLSQLRPVGVSDRAVLAAMGAVPRERFIPAEAAALAYADRPLLLADGSPMMSPAALGKLLDELAPRAGERALVVGGGAAYSADVLRYIGLEVVTADNLDAASGCYDLVLVEGALAATPDRLHTLLADGGRAGFAISDRGVGRLVVASGDKRALGLRTVADTDVPLLPGAAPQPMFSF